VGGRIFATLASVAQGYGNLALTPELQAAFVAELPGVFLPVAGGWGRMGMTHIRLAEAGEDLLSGALQAAWRVRLEKNRGAKGTGSGRTGSRRTGSGPYGSRTPDNGPSQTSPNQTRPDQTSTETSIPDQTRPSKNRDRNRNRTPNRTRPAPGHSSASARTPGGRGPAKAPG